MSDIAEQVSSLCPKQQSQEDSMILMKAALHVRAAEARIAELESLAENLKLQAEGWAQEAITQRATVQACYQVATESTGEPGDWNGSVPVRKRIAELEAELEICKSTLNHANHRYMDAVTRADNYKAMLAKRSRGEG